MLLAELSELHYITPISNLPSIAAKGVLCHRGAARLAAASVAMQVIQDRRAKKSVPGGLPLHDYVNLYFHARNPMMYRLHTQHLGLAVLCIHPKVLNLQAVVIADGNAASDYTGFWPSPAGLTKIDRDLVFAEDWTDPDQIEYWRKKQAKCAEVLVPTAVEAASIVGVRASCNQAKLKIEGLGLKWNVTVDAHLFFQG